MSYPWKVQLVSLSSHDFGHHWPLLKTRHSSPTSQALGQIHEPKLGSLEALHIGW